MTHHTSMKSKKLRPTKQGGIKKMTGYVYITNRNKLEVVCRITAEDGNEDQIVNWFEDEYNGNDYGLTFTPAFGAVFREKRAGG